MLSILGGLHALLFQCRWLFGGGMSDRAVDVKQPPWTGPQDEGHSACTAATYIPTTAYRFRRLEVPYPMWGLGRDPKARYCTVYYESLYLPGTYLLNARQVMYKVPVATQGRER